MASSQLDYDLLLEAMLPVVEHAGFEIMRYYQQRVDAEIKQDGSPVTLADKAAEKVIAEGLVECAPDIQVISEENESSHSISPPEKFFLIDPLDGTKEFLKPDGKGAFTVNVALIEDGCPTFGIIYAPALKRLFYGHTNIAHEVIGGEHCKMSSGEVSEDKVAVASASHRDDKTNQWLEENKISKTVSIGSSIKFCLLANGEADVYPRFGPTMEWDTAAGDAILRSTGGIVTHPDGTVFSYGKPDYRNGAFIARRGHA